MKDENAPYEYLGTEFHAEAVEGVQIQRKKNEEQRGG